MKPAQPAGYVPFSSDRKWSGVTLASGESYVMGAGQFVLKDGFSAIESKVSELAEHARVLVLAKVDGFDGEKMVGTPQPLALVMIRDQIRASAAETIGFFCDQGVDVKVISGDDPRTVSGIAAQVGVPHADRFIDATELDTDEKIADAVGKYSIFGRHSFGSIPILDHVIQYSFPLWSVIWIFYSSIKIESHKYNNTRNYKPN